MSAISTTVQPRDNPATISVVETEWPLLLAACSDDIRALEPEHIRALCRSVRWNILFDLADQHGVQSLLCRALSQVEDAIPTAEQRLTRQLYQTNLHKNMFLARELIRIVEHLSHSGIEVMPYKGVALAEIAYGDIALRKAGDIDLLIRPSDFPRVRDAVAALGYVPQIKFPAAQERAYVKAGYECAFDAAAGRNLLEVQWAIAPRFYAVDFDQDTLFQRSVSVTIAGHVMKSPCMEDLFMILALHAAKHVWGRLLWLCDLARMSRLPMLDWSRIATQARNLGITRVLRVSLLLANQLFNMEIPEAAEAVIPPDPTAAMLAAEIQKNLVSNQKFAVESRSYFRLMLQLRENRADQIRFLSRLLFTPGPGEWEMVRLPRSLFPLYRLVRLYRVARRLVHS